MFPSPGTRQKAGSAFPSGTLMLFQQSAAPLGWTKQTTHNDKALRVVSGAASFGGTNAFSTVMAQTVVGSTTISTATMANHSHTVGADNVTIGCGSVIAGNGNTARINPSTSAVGSGGSHNHTITMSIQYVDLIIARKN